MDRGALWARVHGVAELDMTEHTCTDIHVHLFCFKFFSYLGYHRMLSRFPLPIE